MNYPNPFRIRFVKVFVAICTTFSGRRSLSQECFFYFGGIVQLVEQWDHNP